MTDNREDYIKAIFQFEENNTLVTNKLLAEYLNVSPASTSQMITKLSKEKFVIVKDGHIALLPNAIEIGKLIISKHRLWETFLLHDFNYDWSQVHSDSEKLEHVTSPLLLEKLNEFLKYPKRCPHGGIIYINNTNEYNSTNTLLSLEINQRAIIERFIDEYDLIHFANEKKIKTNHFVKLLNNDPLNKLIVILINNEHVTLSYEIASKIFIETNIN